MFKNSAIIFLVIFFLTGCAATPKVEVLSEKSASPSPLINLKPQKVLLIFDLGLVKEHIAIPEYRAMQNQYDAVAKIIVARVGAQRVLCDYEMRDSASPQSFPSGYSHVLVEHLLSVTQKSSYSGKAYNSSYLMNQKWEAALFDTIKRPVKLIYAQTYSSDAIGCFNSVTDEEICKKDYIEHLLGHLNIIGIKNNVVTSKE
jgi:hypothetical protein